MHNPKLRTWVKLILIALIMGALFLLFRIFPVDRWLEATLNWVRELGVSGWAIFVLVYALAAVLTVPAVLLTLGAGAVYGVLLGTILVTIGATLGATSAFLLGRTFARGWVSKKIARSKRFAAVDEAVGKSGFKIVFMTRLSPVFPYVYLNYMFSLTKVRLNDYVAASFIGMIPATLLYAYLGKIAGDISTKNMPESVSTKLFTWLGLIVTLIVTIYVTRLARKALREAEVQA
jgi:uncharacterized membrane protein YdjX (TVP38/TMEM64 family)